MPATVREPAKARRQLCREAKTKFHGLVRLMVDADLRMVDGVVGAIPD